MFLLINNIVLLIDDMSRLLMVFVCSLIAFIGACQKHYRLYKNVYLQKKHSFSLITKILFRILTFFARHTSKKMEGQSSGRPCQSTTPRRGPGRAAIN